MLHPHLAVSQPLRHDRNSVLLQRDRAHPLPIAQAHIATMKALQMTRS
jgi:hypothetical protein